MNVPDRFPLIDNMRCYGGNFVRCLADAMAAADPANYERLCNAFPDVVRRYSDPDNSPVRDL